MTSGRKGRKEGKETRKEGTHLVHASAAVGWKEEGMMEGRKEGRMKGR
jgi:hypothetical protein